MRNELQKLGDEFYKATGVVRFNGLLNVWLIRDRGFRLSRLQWWALVALIGLGLGWLTSPR